MTIPLFRCDSCRVETYQSFVNGEECSFCHKGVFRQVEQPATGIVQVDGQAQSDFAGAIHIAGFEDVPPMQIDQPKRKGPKVSRDDAAELWHLLADGQFHKAKDLPINSRMVRAICQEYPKYFISTQDGYKRLDKATEAEVDAAIADLRSRAWHLLNRVRGHEKAQRDKRQGEL